MGKELDDGKDTITDADVEYARKWRLLAIAIGFNELAKLGKTLGEKVYARLARDQAADEYEAVTGIANLFAKEGSIVEIEVPGPMPHVRFTASDIELMRAAVAAHDEAHR